MHPCLRRPPPVQGNRVFAVSDSFFSHQSAGAYAEYASVAEGQLAPMPKGLSFEECAAVPLVALTAWQVCRAARRGAGVPWLAASSLAMRNASSSLQQPHACN